MIDRPVFIVAVAFMVIAALAMNLGIGTGHAGWRNLGIYVITAPVILFAAMHLATKPRGRLKR